MENNYSVELPSYMLYITIYPDPFPSFSKIPNSYLSDLLSHLNFEEDTVPINTFFPPSNTIHVNDSDYKKRRKKSGSDILHEREQDDVLFKFNNFN